MFGNTECDRERMLTMYRYPIDQRQLGEKKLVSTETVEYDGEVMKRDGVPVRRCSVLVTPPNDRPEVMEIEIPSEDPIEMAQLTPVVLDNLTVRSRVNQVGRLVIKLEADAIRIDQEAAKAEQVAKHGETPKPESPAVKPFAVK
ncbi:hypothetical protein [Bifidobacterium sp. SO4]|uniref:hypothetical protein n=1 Tax=Bifidobacterium sp. SO4 TaxID=2809030 RepID=UPI001BDCCAFB|nr:hypothetical protein [Bifidobacterium sp. SO4]MBT1171007.1 hypothetical protein [Bifidobacterium sp. SO4]